ncbi:MAG: (2E,6E)-farnesyl diphosphate synthase [Candidatus Dasytiphilus stammeri]
MNFPKFLIDYNLHINLELEKLMETLPYQHTPLVKAMKYSLLSGGKRLRPFLVYAVGKMIDSNNFSLDVPAMAIECIHTYSLIHDDLPFMDKNLLRRGKPSCHVKFGADIAILAGNALQSLAFSIITEKLMPEVKIENRLAMIQELSLSIGLFGMCMGQSFDIVNINKAITIKTLENIYQYKTGSLLRSAVRLGRLTSAKNINNDISTALDNYANAIGLAFQIQDDILDILGDTKKMGKIQGIDKKLNKKTYPSLIGIDNARQKTIDLYQEAIKALYILKEASFDTKLLQNLAKYIIRREK